MTVFSSVSLETADIGIPADRPRVWKWAIAWILLFPLLALFVGMDTPFQASSSSESAQYFHNDTSYAVGHSLAIGTWLLCLLAMRSRLSRLVRLSFEMKGILALSLLTVVSAIWSQEPLTTLLKCPFIFLGMLFAFWLYDRFTTDELIELLLMMGAVCILCSIAIVVISPSYGIDADGNWRGLFFHKNRLARGMLLLLPPALLIRTRGHGSFLRAAYILALLFLIVMSGSRTAWIALAGFLPLYWLIPVFSRLRRKDQFSSLLVLSGFLALGAFLVYYNFGDITRGLGKDPTLTGRTTNWLPMVHAILKRPLLGYGFGAFWLGSKGESLNIFLETGMILAQGHNAYVDLLLDLGLVGLVAFLITGVSAIRNALRSLRSDHVDSVKLYLSWLLIMLPLSITQGQFLYENDLFLIVYFVTCIGLYKGGGGGAEGRGSGKLTGVKPRTV